MTTEYKRLGDLLKSGGGCASLRYRGCSTLVLSSGQTFCPPQPAWLSGEAQLLALQDENDLDLRTRARDFFKNQPYFFHMAVGRIPWFRKHCRQIL